MPKAILEVEMPESCWKCEYCTIFDVCSVLSNRSKSDTDAIVPGEGRRLDCPLKLVDGQFIELPCKVGDTVYIIYGKNKILETKVDLRAWTDDDGWILRTKEGHFYEKYIGKEIFSQMKMLSEH